jgi:hypothetical protein
VVKLTAALEHGTGKDAVAGFTEGVKSHSYYSDILKVIKGSQKERGSLPYHARCRKSERRCQSRLPGPR